MNVLFICDEYPPGKNGGIGTSVQTLGRELVKQGHCVFVAGLYAFSYGEKNYEEDQGVKVWRKRYGLNLGKEHHIFYKALNKLPGFVRKNLNGKKAFTQFIAFLQNIVSREKIDIIEIADYNTFSMHIGFQVTWPEFGVPLVLKSHGSHTYFCREMDTKPGLMFEAADRLLFQRANALSAVSRYTAEVNRKIFQFNRPVAILYNGIQINHLPPVQRRKNRVIFTGSLQYKKRDLLADEGLEYGTPPV